MLDPKGKWWPHRDLNQGHTDFQSVALPTELCGRADKIPIGRGGVIGEGGGSVHGEFMAIQFFYGCNNLMKRWQFQLLLRIIRIKFRGIASVPYE